MRIALCPADEGGCGLHRIINPARAVHNAFADEGVTVFFGKGLNVKINHMTDKVYQVPKIEADVIVIQRPLERWTYEAIPLIQAQGVAVVVEIDDDFELVNPDNLAWAPVQPHLSPNSNWQWVHKSAAIADMVTVSTPALTRYGRPGRVRVIPNRLPGGMLDLGAKKIVPDFLRVGWAGTVDTHPHDLKQVGWGVSRALDETFSRFVVVGYGRAVKDHLRLSEDPDVLGWSHISEYPEQLRDAFEVGIVPLQRSRFNEAKSALKGLEMAALGIPFIASPTQPYLEAAQRGIGVIARKPHEWYKLLKRMLTDDAWRKEVIEASQDGIRSRYLLEDHAHEWLEAWIDAVALRRKSREAVTT